MASCDTQRIESGFTERLFYTQDRAEHFTKQYIKADTSNKGAVRQTEKLLWIQSQFHTLGGGQLRESMLSKVSKLLLLPSTDRAQLVSMQLCPQPAPGLHSPLVELSAIALGSHDSLQVST